MLTFWLPLKVSQEVTDAWAFSQIYKMGPNEICDFAQALEISYHLEQEKYVRIIKLVSTIKASETRPCRKCAK